LAGLDKGGRSALFRENKGGHNILFTRKSAIPPSCPPFPGNGSENIGSSKPKVGAPENEAQVDLEAGKWAVDYTEKHGWRLVIDADGERLKPVPIAGREQLSPDSDWKVLLQRKYRDFLFFEDTEIQGGSALPFSENRGSH
jgi:hypothetical protein